MKKIYDRLRKYSTFAERIHDSLMTVPGLLTAVRKRLDRALAIAAELLGKYRASLERVADALDRSGYLSADEITELVGTTEPGRLGRAADEPGMQPALNGGGQA